MSGLRISTMASLLLLALPIGAVAQADSPAPTQSIAFDAPMGFSEPRLLGREALGLFYPAQASPGNEQMRITLVELGADRTEWLNMSDQELMSYVKYLFLGVNNPARSYQQRTILGQSVRGEVHLRQRRQGVTYLELYLVPLTAGQHVVLAFESDIQMPLQKSEAAIQALTQSLKELPPEPKKRRSRPRRSPLDPL